MAPDPTGLRWRPALAVLGQVLAVAFVVAPVAVVHAIGNVHFDDRLGTVPVEVSLCHNGHTSLETGLLGTVYYERTGFLGFGACMRITEPPEAGGTLGSYVDPAFVRTNAQLVDDPDAVAAAYGREFARSFRHELLRSESVAVVLGLLVLVAVRRPRRSGDEMPWWGARLHVAERLVPYPLVRAVLWPALVVSVAFLVSGVVAARVFDDWSGTRPVGQTYPLEAVAGLSFSSPQAREIAAQVQPFIEKNTDRLAERADEFEDDAARSFEAEVARVGSALEPRAGEQVVIAEADPQGSFTGNQVRERIYPALLEAVGGTVSLRTISGDVTSNGTVAEDSFVRAETDALDVPTVAVKGDHDSPRTVEQMRDRGIGNPDVATQTVDGLRVTVANDPEFKTLFGGSVTNPSGVSEAATGKRLREYVDPGQPRIVVVHQPALAAAYLGLGSLNELSRTTGHDRMPWDDGIPDVPPGTVDVGHSHRSIGPYVIWNTDTDQVTWTVVDRLGTSGGAENSPTFNRFSTPTSVPLKPIELRLQYFDRETGLQTGYATVSIGTDTRASISARVDVGLPLDR